MSSSVYCTFDSITEKTGAGKVCIHEINALKQVTDLKQVVSKQEIGEHIDRYYPFNPFLYDYFASQLLPSSIDMAHLSCSPANAILNKVHPKKYLVNIVAHDLKLSIEEHERIFGTKYPYPHNTDSYLHDMLLRHAKKADVVLTPSECSATWIKENINPNRIEVIPHGADYPKEILPLPERFTVGYLGVFGADKGIIYLLMAWNHLNYSDCKLVFAGSCSPFVDGLVKQLGYKPSSFELLGYIQNVDSFFNSISVLVLPSTTEGFGMTVLEAMVHGRSVIVSEGAGSSMLVEDGKEGFVVPIRNPKAIAEKIEYFKINPSEIKRMSENARVKAKQYTWEKIEKRYVDVYSSV